MVNTHFSVKFIVTEVQRRVDRFERFEIDVDFLFFAVIGNDRTTINNETIVRH